ncbi:hypothetical protein CBOM_04288 [Ceraceosorus bombacis]|uniref:Uncharacterized protein n=1 Tax=Ceraceosorus bombacis TaxID=401625 RepID=A0A0P1BMH1_9BASI|nr:hypothetical protein CBOM_04288 [Ceraceosorus bombacis]
MQDEGTLYCNPRPALPQNLLFGLSASTDLTRRESLDLVKDANSNDVHILEASRSPGPLPVPYRSFISRVAVHAKAGWT